MGPYKILIHIPTASYFWSSAAGYHHGDYAAIDEFEGDLKITAFQEINGIYTNMGTAIFRIGLADRPAEMLLKVPLGTVKPPTFKTGWKHQSTLYKHEITIAVSLPLTVQNVEKEYRHIADTLIETPRLTGPAYGFIRDAQYAFDFPFPIPGAYGLRYMSVKAPFDWEAATKLAMSVLGYDTFPYSIPALADLALNALGSIGWSNVYANEKIDDIAPIWASLGTGKDCEDMALSAAAAFYEVCTKGDPLARFVARTFTDAYLCVGWGQVRGKKIGHAWVVLDVAEEFKGKLGARVTCEATSPMINTVAAPKYLMAGFMYGQDSAVAFMDKDKVGVRYSAVLDGSAATKDISGTNVSLWKKLCSLDYSPSNLKCTTSKAKFMRLTTPGTSFKVWPFTRVISKSMPDHTAPTLT